MKAAQRYCYDDADNNHGRKAEHREPARRSLRWWAEVEFSAAFRAITFVGFVRSFPAQEKINDDDDAMMWCWWRWCLHTHRHTLLLFMLRRWLVAAVLNANERDYAAAQRRNANDDVPHSREATAAATAAS